MASLQQGNNLPLQQAPFVNKDGTLSYDGYQFFLSFLQRVTQAQSTSTVAADLTATGATQATALPLDSQWNVVSTVPAGSGVMLESLQPGQSQSVINAGANNLNVYPPPGFSIGSAATNAPYVLVPGKMQTFQFVSDSQILTTQLQIP